MPGFGSMSKATAPHTSQTWQPERRSSLAEERY
jgi:hypothetical protein